MKFYLINRGFDQDMAKRIGVYMEQNNCKFQMKKVPTSCERLENGRFKVYFQDTDKTQPIESEEFDTVLLATGRYPDTLKLGCESNFP